MNPISIKFSTVLFLAAVLFSALGCSEKAEKEIVKPEKFDTHYSWIQDSFEEIKIDRLYIFSSWVANSDNYKFKGKVLNGEQLMAFPEKCWNPSTEKTIYSACYKFKIDESRTGLIIRSPGKDNQTLIQLALFHHNFDRVIRIVDLADVYTNVGEKLSSSSFLFEDENGDIQLLKYTHKSIKEADNTFYTNNDSYHLLHVSKNWMDTISIDSSYIISKHPNMVLQLTGL